LSKGDQARRELGIGVEGKGGRRRKGLSLRGTTIPCYEFERTGEEGAPQKGSSLSASRGGGFCCVGGGGEKREQKSKL